MSIWISPYPALFLPFGGAQQFTQTGASAPVWSALFGAISASGLYLPPEQRCLDEVTLTDGEDSLTTTVNVVKVFRWRPQYTSPMTVSKNVKLTVMEDGTRVTRTKRGKKRKYELSFERRTRDEYLSIEDFWDEHYPNGEFFYEDLSLRLSGLYVFDSDIRWEPSSTVSHAFSLVIQEV